MSNHGCSSTPPIRIHILQVCLKIWQYSGNQRGLNGVELGGRAQDALQSLLRYLVSWSLLSLAQFFLPSEECLSLGQTSGKSKANRLRKAPLKPRKSRLWTLFGAPKKGLVQVVVDRHGSASFRQATQDASDQRGCSLALSHELLQKLTQGVLREFIGLPKPSCCTEASHSAWKKWGFQDCFGGKRVNGFGEHTHMVIGHDPTVLKVHMAILPSTNTNTNPEKCFLMCPEMLRNYMFPGCLAIPDPSTPPKRQHTSPRMLVRRGVSRLSSWPSELPILARAASRQVVTKEMIT